MTGSRVLTGTLTTTNSSVTNILTIPIPNDSVVNVIYRILGVSSTVNASSYYYTAAFARQVTAENAEGIMTLINAEPHTIGTDAISHTIGTDDVLTGGSCTFADSVAFSTQNLVIRVAGNSSSTVKWYIVADIIETAK